jgi:hypothetical protein
MCTQAVTLCIPASAHRTPSPTASPAASLASCLVKKVAPPHVTVVHGARYARGAPTLAAAHGPVGRPGAAVQSFAGGVRPAVMCGCGNSCVSRPGFLIRAASAASIFLTLGWVVWVIWVSSTYGSLTPQDRGRLFNYLFNRAVISAYLRWYRFCQLVYAYTVMGYAILSYVVSSAFRPVA